GGRRVSATRKLRNAATVRGRMVASGNLHRSRDLLPVPRPNLGHKKAQKAYKKDLYAPFVPFVADFLWLRSGFPARDVFKLFGCQGIDRDPQRAQLEARDLGIYFSR